MQSSHDQEMQNQSRPANFEGSSQQAWRIPESQNQHFEQNDSSYQMHGQPQNSSNRFFGNIHGGNRNNSRALIQTQGGPRQFSNSGRFGLQVEQAQSFNPHRPANSQGRAIVSQGSSRMKTIQPGSSAMIPGRASFEAQTIATSAHIPKRPGGGKFRIALPHQGDNARRKVSGQHWGQSSDQISNKRHSQGPGLRQVKSRVSQTRSNQSDKGEEPPVASQQSVQGALKIRDQLQKLSAKGKPYQFLSGIGAKETAPVALLHQVSARSHHEKAFGILPQKALPQEATEPQQPSQFKIFTELNVGQQLAADGKSLGGPLRNYVLADLRPEHQHVQITHREQKDFKISSKAGGLRRNGSAAGVSSRLSRRSLQEIADPTSRAVGSESQQAMDRDITEGDIPTARLHKIQSKRSELDPSGEPDELNEGLVDSFGQKLMTSRPTTALLRDSDSKLPYPCLFDRSERTFAATFAKFGDLSYFTPVQRIGIYMDYSQRLKKRHLTDLVAYLKTAKHAIKPVEEDAGTSPEQAAREFRQHCLFHGSMPLEDPPRKDLGVEDPKRRRKQEKEAMKRVYDFPLPLLEDRGQFDYNQVWSEDLMRQVEVSTHRYRRYIESQDSIRPEEVAKFKKEWIQRAADLIPDHLLQNYSSQVKAVFQEVFSSYVRAMKAAILEYILRSPDERKRLHILMLPQGRTTSAQRDVKNGGYSILRYPGHHQRRLEAEQQLKYRLLTCNVVTSSLCSWWAEFEHLNLVELRSLGQFIKEKDPGQPGSAIYAMEIEQFLGFQMAYIRKVVALLRHVWHRGCILIIKKFKMLRTLEEMKAATEGSRGMAGKGKWTLRGFKAGQTEKSERRWVGDAVWRAVYQFDYDDKMTPLQAYYMRSAAVIQNIHLSYFLNEEGMECTDILGEGDLLEGAGIKDLSDIRDSHSYRAFVKLVGGSLDLKENGYKALTKPFRRDIKQSAGILMETQLRTVIDRTITTLRNFFQGFLTLEQLKQEVGGKPLRIIRPLVTYEPTAQELEENPRIPFEKLPPEIQELRQARGAQTRSRQPQVPPDRAHEAARRKNPALAAQLARRRQEEERRRQEAVQASGLEAPLQSSEEELRIPEFLDYQDLVSPVFRLDLHLGRDDGSIEEGGRQQTPKTIEFSHSDEAILAGFATLVDRVADSLSDFLRPEYSKVAEVSGSKLAADKEEFQENLRLADPLPAFSLAERGSQGQKTGLKRSAGVPQDFESLLYKGQEIGPEIYRQYLGRIKVHESIPKSRIGKISKHSEEEEGAVQREPKYLSIASSQEAHFVAIKQEILGTIRVHLKETKRVLEVFEQFQGVIRGSLGEKVARFLHTAEGESSGQRIGDRDYATIIKELRYYQRLSRQLPSLVFLPVFEVGVKEVKEEIQRRLDLLLSQVFDSYEERVYKNSQAICAKYEAVAMRLGESLQDPDGVASMERYKNNLLLQMGRLNGEIRENSEAVFFLLRADRLLKEETQSLVIKLHGWPGRLDDHIAASEERHAAERAALEADVKERRRVFIKETAELESRVRAVANWSDAATYRNNHEKLTLMQDQLLGHQEKMNTLLEQERAIFGSAGELEGFRELRAWFAPYFRLGTGVHRLFSQRRHWRGCLLPQIDPSQVDELVRNTTEGIKALSRELGGNSAVVGVLDTQRHDVAELTRQLPFIEVLCSPALRPRHWTAIQEVLKSAASPTALTLGQLLELLPLDSSLQELDRLSEISEKAEREARLERKLNEMELEWKGQTLELIPYRDNGLQVLQGSCIEENQARLEEHCLLAHSIRSSPDVGPLQGQAESWEKKLNLIQEILEIWVRVQANFLYLEPVMRSGDISATLPQESKEFNIAADAWTALVARISPQKEIVQIPEDSSIIQLLQDSDQRLERILKSMSAYLETKREAFARFYFLSNEELLDALGQSNRPERVQQHLKKCFEGIDHLQFRQQPEGVSIVALLSPEGEQIKIREPIVPADSKFQVELWLLQLETQMSKSIQDLISRCITQYSQSRQDEEKRAKWLQDWPGQTILAASQESWTTEVEEALRSENPELALQNTLLISQTFLAQIVALVRENQPPLTRITLGALVVLEVHAKDVLAGLVANKTISPTDFDWVAQLRYYFDAEASQLEMRMVTAGISYGHEYLGNTSRLVITPLTDRCYRTLMSALELNLGGAPEGPAGTGKTETTKDLAKAAAVHCLVFNCADGLDALSMAKFFKGLASAGSWSCFDEFNRIDVEVLSVVAQQILDIQTAKSQNKEEFLFEETVITLRRGCNIFITMNPGYAGRSQLPDNLKSLFRPVSMMVPDYAMIGEISLYSFGFQHSRKLATKIVAAFRLCSEQLSSQHHYDYGMRAVKSVLQAARLEKLRYPEESEAALILRSVTNISLPKFLAHDIPLFQGIVGDLFQRSLVPVQYNALETSIRTIAREFCLQATDEFIEKILQLYEMMNARHGLMLVGPPLSAKSSTYKVLAAALTDMASRNEADEKALSVSVQVLNPKSLALSELYGSFDAISHEFTDGVLGRIFRDCAGPGRQDSFQWIVLDGPVDAEWIENMNTVLDDNKKLCLLNGEVIMMSENMRLVFEADELSQASPATVSRCGMVYLEPSMLGVESHLHSWLALLEPKLQSREGNPPRPAILQRIPDLFEALFHDCAKFATHESVPLVPCSEVQLARSLMRLFEALLLSGSFVQDCHDPHIRLDEVIAKLDMHFLYALIWSVGSIGDEDGQKGFSKRLRDASAGVHQLSDGRTLKLDRTCLVPDGGQNVHEYLIEEQRWISWRERLSRVTSSAALHGNSGFDSKQTLVPTTESLKIASTLELCQAYHLPLLLVGPTGTGKSSSILQVLRAAPRSTKTSIQITFSAKTTTKQTGEILLAKLQKTGRRVVGPAPGKRATLFVDDLNMPALEKYGAQPPVELIRQLIDHQAWYDQSEPGRPRKEILGTDYIAAMGPPGGGRNKVTPRLTRHFNVVSLTNFSHHVLVRIFSARIEDHFANTGFSGPACAILKAAVAGSVDILLFAQKTLRPTPSKSHYLFNLRDLSRVVQGLQKVGKEQLTADPKKAIRLWVHEVARVFSDRLTSLEDQSHLFTQLKLVSRQTLREDLIATFRPSYAALAGDATLLSSGVLFTDIGAGPGHYDEVLPADREPLKQHLRKVLEDFNTFAKKPLSIVLFDSAVVHLARICRVLKRPQGHAFLIGLGGTGRQSLTRLAASLCELTLADLEASRNYSEEQWRLDLKATLLAAGQEGKSSVLLLPDSKICGDFMLDDVNNLLNAGAVPNLFQADERIQIEESLRGAAKKAGRLTLHTSGTHEDYEDYFVERTTTNLHVVLAMSPVGEALRSRIRNFPSLVNCCTIDWHSSWPDEALEAVCYQILDEVDLELEQRRNIGKACVRLQHAALELCNEYLETQRRHVYVTPTSYLEHLKTYRIVLMAEREKTHRLSNGYSKGVEKLLQTAEVVRKMQQELNEKQPRLEEMTQEADILMQQIKKESTEVVEPKQAQIAAEEAEANLVAKAAQEMKKECDEDLGKALPALKKAQDALNTIKSADITELKHAQKPPEPVKRVLHAVCVMCQRKVERTPKKDNPKVLEENWWYTSQKFMGEKNFLQGLLEFDKDHIPEPVLRKIRDNFLEDPDFKPSRVEKASVAAKGLCQWVRALDQYAKVANVVAPKRSAAKDAEKKYKSCLQGLETKQAELREIILQFTVLQTKLEDTEKHRQSLEEDIRDCENRLRRATTLLEGLGGEQKRWENAAQALEGQSSALVGDCLIAAATIAYLGPITGEYRISSVQAWHKTVQECGLPASPDYSLQRLLGEPVTIRQWTISGLPSDSFSIDNGIIATRARRWPLMIDPQGQASKWIKNMDVNIRNSQGGERKLVVIKPSDKNWTMRFQQCIPLGIPLLLESVGEELDPILEPLLERQTIRKAAGLSLEFGDTVLDYSTDFRFYMTSKLANPHFLPEASGKVALINFGITFDGLKEQLMDHVVQAENAALDDERQSLILATYENKRAQREIEQRILEEVLRTSKGNILDDEDAIRALADSQLLAEEIKHKQEVANETQKKLDLARRGYAPVAHRCGLLFFLVSKLVQVDVMYQYSLTWFLQLFSLALADFRKFGSKVEPEEDTESENTQKENTKTENTKTENTKTENTEINKLVEYFTHLLYSSVCRSLFEKDKLLFSFLLAATLAQARGVLSQTDYNLLVEPLERLEPSQQDSQNEMSTWLADERWQALCSLARKSPKILSIVRDFKSNETYWRQVVEAGNPFRELFPPLSIDGQTCPLDNFSKLCIIKALAPGKFIPCMREVVILEQGEEYLSPPLFDIERSFQDSSPATPLIFVLPGADPLQALTLFAKSKKKSETLKTISLGQGQGKRAEQAIAEARKFGGWVMLQNCHLFPSWMPQLEQICDQLAGRFGLAGGDQNSSVHPAFRLWLSSYPSPSFPALVLRNGIKMTNEPPSGLKANMLRSLNSVKPLLKQMPEGEPATRALLRVVYGLCLLHAVLEGRREFGSLGWTARYSFSISDLQITAKQLLSFSQTQKRDTAVSAVARLAGDCNYGGRLTDERDRRILFALLEDFCTPAILRPGYEVRGLRAFGLPEGGEILQDYHNHIQSLPLEEPPELFGLHSNASISKNLREMGLVCGRLHSLGEVEGLQGEPANSPGQEIQEFVTGSSAGSGNQPGPKTDEARVAAACLEVLSRLPSSLVDIEVVRATYPLMRERSMNSVLVQELQRFYPLIERIKQSLQSLLDTLRGEQVASTATEAHFAAVLLGKVPECWRSVSYPSERGLGSFVSDLCRRLEVLMHWVEHGPPLVFWLPGFFFPQAFLTAVLQDHARRERIEIDALQLEWFVGDQLIEGPGSEKNFEALDPPDFGTYITGIFLEGASWSPSSHCLIEAGPGELYGAVPVILLAPKRVSLVLGSTLAASQEGLPYECPLYRTPARLGSLTTTGHSTNFIAYVPLPSGDCHPEHWCKRGTALLCELAE